jgi:hypothetical protein
MNSYAVYQWFYTSQETINSASSITQSFSSELLDGQRKLLSFLASGNAKVQSTNALQPSSGPMGGLREVSTHNFPHSMTLMFTIYLFISYLFASNIIEQLNDSDVHNLFILFLVTCLVFPSWTCRLRMLFLFVCVENNRTLIQSII